MEEDKSEETFFIELMSKSRLTFPFPDLEDNVMRIVELSQTKKNTIKREIRLSWIFFLLGSIFGITISILLPQLQVSVADQSLDKFVLPFQILFTFIFVNQLNNLIDLYKKINKTKR